MASLADLAKRLAALGTIPAEAMAAGVGYADRQIRRAGRAGGPLRKGNAVAADVEPRGLSMKITRIGSTKGNFAYGIRADFIARWVTNEIQRLLAERGK